MTKPSRNFAPSSCARRDSAIGLRELAWLQKPPAALEERALPLELRARLKDAIALLSADQRRVFETLAFDAVPIDVLAAQLRTTRAAVYETLRSARGVLRERLAAREEL